MTPEMKEVLSQQPERVKGNKRVLSLKPRSYYTPTIDISNILLRYSSALQLVSN